MYIKEAVFKRHALPLSYWNKTKHLFVLRLFTSDLRLRKHSNDVSFYFKSMQLVFVEYGKETIWVALFIQTLPNFRYSPHPRKQLPTFAFETTNFAIVYNAKGIHVLAIFKDGGLFICGTGVVKTAGYWLRWTRTANKKDDDKERRIEEEDERAGRETKEIKTIYYWYYIRRPLHYKDDNGYSSHCSLNRKLIYCPFTYQIFNLAVYFECLSVDTWYILELQMSIPGIKAVYSYHTHFWFF